MAVPARPIRQRKIAWARTRVIRSAGHDQPKSRYSDFKGSRNRNDAFQAGADGLHDIDFIIRGNQNAGA